MAAYLSFCTILEVCCCLVKLLHQRPLPDALRPLESHWLVTVGYDDVLGPILQALQAIV